jgi:hypothetical protein
MKTAKSKLPKVKTISKLIEDLDDAFSLFIRSREKDEYGYAKCFTCGKRDLPKNLQCGHYWSRKHLALRFDEINCAVQCVSCNVFKEGNKPAFTLALMRKYGNDVVEKLEWKVKSFWKPTRFELEILIQEYKKKFEAL